MGVVISLLVLAWVLLVVAQLRTMKMLSMTRKRQAETALIQAQLVEAVQDIYLSPEERELLGRNKPVVISIPTDKQTKAAAKGTKVRPNQMTPCTEHEWCAAYPDYPRRSVNNAHADSDGGVYVRTCLRCDWRQVRGATTLNRTGPSYYWWDD